MRRLLILLAGVLGALPVVAQDIILLRDAREIRAEVTEVDERSIVYRNFGDSHGPIRRIGKAEVVSVTYANGEKEVYAAASGTSGVSDADYPYPPVSRSYVVGELFSEGGVVGIVIHVTDGGRHGLLVSLDMNEAAFADDGLEKEPIGLDDAEDGWRNMQLLQRFVQANSLSWGCFPAFAWCRGLGPGWYLPAVNEMRYLSCFAEGGRYPQTDLEIYRMCRNMGRACEEWGGASFGPFSAYPLSSTEASADMAWHMRPDREKGVRPRDCMDKALGWSLKAFHRF